MTDQPFTIPFSLRDDVLNRYWLRMELVEEKSTMTVGEAADLIDALYETSICGEKPEASTEPEAKPVPGDEDWIRALRVIMSMPSCDGIEGFNAGDSGAYDVQVKIYRSHQRELYKIVLSNGTAHNVRRISERVELTLDIEDQSSITLDTPIVAYPSIAWQDIDGPAIKIRGNTLYWTGKVTGVIRAEFDTIYDLVNIHVNGIANTSSQVITGSLDARWLGSGWYSGSEDGTELTDVQDTECTLLGFYHYQYEELILHKPENDESVTADQAGIICSEYGATQRTTDTDVTDDDGEKRCYRSTKITKICRCGGAEEVVVEDIPVVCPEGIAAGAKVGDDLIETRYVECGCDDETVHNSEFYLEKCCEVPPEGVVLPCCEENYGPFVGKDSSDTQDLKDAYGEDVIVIAVGPIKGGCGQTIITQEVPSPDCCNVIPDIVDNGSDDSTEDGGVVRFTGGIPPYHVTDETGADYWLGTENVTFNQETGLWEGEFSVSVPTDPCSGNSVWYKVEDECSNLSDSMGTPNTYVPMNQYGRIVVSPGTTVSISFTGGGVGPYTWRDSQFLTFDTSVTSGNSNVADVDEEFCGSDSVQITDSCGKYFDLTVNSTDGEWVYDACPIDDSYCCNNGLYGGGCMDPEGETVTLGTGTAYETTIPSATGYNGDVKGVFGVDGCSYINTVCDDGYQCGAWPDRCLSGPSMWSSFECYLNRGSEAHGTCGHLAGFVDFRLAQMEGADTYDSVSSPCAGITKGLLNLVDDYGNSYTRCTYGHYSMYGTLYKWECY